MVELVDTRDLKSLGHRLCRFKPGSGYQKSEPPAKRVVCSGPVRACYRLRLKTLAFTLFKPSALAALATP